MKQSLAAPVPVAATPTAEAIGSTQAGETPACPPPDAWGRDPLGEGILVTVWSDHADDVTVLVRTSTGPDRARSAVIDPRDRFHIFAFPDVDHRAVVDTLVMTNTENCYATLDPATDSG